MRRLKRYVMVTAAAGATALILAGCDGVLHVSNLKHALDAVVSATSYYSGSLTSGMQDKIAAASSKAQSAVQKAVSSAVSAGEKASSAAASTKKVASSATKATVKKSEKQPTGSSSSSKPVTPIVPVQTAAPSAPAATSSTAQQQAAVQSDDGAYFGSTAMQDVKVYEYGKSLLDSHEQDFYSQFANGVMDAETTFEITSDSLVTSEEFGKIFNYFWNDHSEVFYLSGASYQVSGTRQGPYTYTMHMTYSYDTATIKQMYADMASGEATIYQKAVNSLAAGQTGDYYMEKALHNALINSCRYDTTAITDEANTPAESFTACGALVKGVAVCDGYARAMKILLSTAGIKSLYVTGTGVTSGSSGGHAWNMAYVPGTDGTYRWYYLDSTWDDPISENANGTFREDGLSYLYFNFVNEPADPSSGRVVTHHDLGTYCNFDPAASSDDYSQNYETMPQAGTTDATYTNT